MKTLALSSPGYQRQAKLKHSRLCFSGSLNSSSLSFDSLSNILQIGTYPNYAINDDGKILKEEAKPKKSLTMLKNVTIKFEYLQKLEEIYTDFSKIENKLSSVSHILIIFAREDGHYFFSSGSFVLALINKNLFVLTVLHVLNFVDLPKIFLLNFSNEDLFDLLDIFLKYKKYDLTQGIDLNFIKDFSEFASKMKKKPILIIPATIDMNFLNFRKNELLNEQNAKLFIDGKYGMKPSPAFDFALLTIDLPYRDQLPKTLNPFKIDFPTQLDELQIMGGGSLIGFHNTRGDIELSSKEYCYTLEALPKQLISSLRFLKLDFFAETKSISPIDVNFSDNSFLLFQSNTGEGSSGGPIINKNGELLGLNLGNYCDIEEEETLPFADDLFSFDIKLMIENKSNYDTKKPKNFNIGIAIIHPLIQKYFIGK